MLNFAGKKLLILGANPETIPLIERANELGVHTIVTDYLSDSPGKRVARESHDVDGLDVEGLVALGRERQVDGVLVGVADRLIVPYQKVCEQLDLPCYGTAYQCKVFTDKEFFANECAKYGINTIPMVDLPFEPSSTQLSKIPYPVLIKPPDGNSGNGMTVCRNPLDVQGAINRAIEASKTGRYLVERYMECDDSYIFYTFVDGEIWPSVIASRYTYRAQEIGSPVCIGAVSPSRSAQLSYETLHEKMCAMFSGLHVKNGILMISAFVDDGGFYLYDPGFRLQGEAPNLIVREMTGFNHYDMLIGYALTGDNPYKSDKSSLVDCREWGFNSATVWFLLQEGTIAGLEGADSLMQQKGVYDSVVRLGTGDTVSKEMIGTEQQVLARVYLKARTLDKLKEYVDNVCQSIKVTDEDGVSLLSSCLSSSVIY